MPRNAAPFVRSRPQGGAPVSSIADGRENAYRASQGVARPAGTGPRAALAVARFGDALHAPDTSTVGGARRALFLAALALAPATAAQLHALTGLAPGSRPNTTRLLSNLHAEGVVDRTRINVGPAHAWLYRLPISPPEATRPVVARPG
jgi:hypothetical protein